MSNGPTVRECAPMVAEPIGARICSAVTARGIIVKVKITFMI